MARKSLWTSAIERDKLYDTPYEKHMRGEWRNRYPTLNHVRIIVKGQGIRSGSVAVVTTDGTLSQDDLPVSTLLSGYEQMTRDKRKHNRRGQVRKMRSTRSERSRTKRERLITLTRDYARRMRGRQP